METGVYTQRGLYFTSELEMQRAMMVLAEYGFVADETMVVKSSVEIQVAAENERLLRKYNAGDTRLF